MIGKAEGSIVEYVRGTHTCGQPLEIGGQTDADILRQIQDCVRNTNDSPLSLAVQVKSMLSDRPLGEETVAFLESNLLVEHIRSI